LIKVTFKIIIFGLVTIVSKNTRFQAAEIVGERGRASAGGIPGHGRSAESLDRTAGGNGGGAPFFFVGAIAHDLRSPLFVLRGYLLRLEKGLPVPWNNRKSTSRFADKRRTSSIALFPIFSLTRKRK
jgi:signal transduction histidine kinase